MIDALPDEVTEDNAEAVAQALTDIDDAKESLTDEELAGLDFARYDAAANALLALLGEAPADAVETLDDYPEPGKEGEWYVIDSVDDLYWLAKSAPMNFKAKLTAEITINSSVLDDDGNLISNPKLEEWKPIGTSNNPFKGTFDGQGHTISGLYVNLKKNYVGLFGCVGKGGTVKNVTLADSYVSGANYVGGICGQNKCGTLQNCHNTGKVSGKSYVGGVCGSNARQQSSDPSSTIQECYNTGKVSGRDYVGGVCGQNNRATVEKSYNTNTVSGGGRVGGVCGENNYSGTVNGCYNTGDVSGTGFNVGGVCGYNYDDGTVKGTVENCYYLAGTSANAVGNGTDGVNCASKTADEFRIGKVAFLLQKALGQNAEQVWGQKIGIDTYPKLGGDKVYQSAPCTADYSNTEIPPKQHVIGNDGKCTNCGAQCIAYTVTIPATVELGNKATIKAKDVILPNGKTLNVKVAEGSKFEVAQVDDNDAVVDKCAYTVTKGETKTPVNPSDTVLTAVNGESEKTVELQFNKPETTTYSGEYKGTVKFTVSVE